MTDPWSPPPGVGGSRADDPTTRPGGTVTGDLAAPDAPPGGPTVAGPASVVDAEGASVVGPSAPAPSSGPGAGDPDVDWRHLHKVTPLLNAWKAAAVVVGIVAWNFADNLGEIPITAAQRVLAVVGAVLLGALVGLVYSAVAWRRTRYGIGDDSIYLHSGVLWRQQRHVRLDRLQAVDVTQPLLARIFGFASLKIESAGGAGSNLTLSYLTETEAQRLRNEILARAAGVRPGPAAAVPGAPAGAPGTGTPAPAVSPQAPEQQLLELSAGRLVASLALSIGMMIAVLALLAVAVTVVVTGRVSFLAGMLPALLGAGGYVWSRFAGEFAFRVATSPDGIRLRHGLLEAKARTVPPGRVQAVQVSQGRLWRSRGWWRVSINIAGYGPEEQTSSVLYPVATAAELARILPLVLPDLGTSRPLEVLGAGLEGVGEDEGFVTSSPRARLFDPFTWRRNGVAVTDTAVLLRTGRWWRRLVLVPHERTQSLALVQGPWDRRRRLAGIQLHSTPGQITPQVQHLDVDVARTFLLAQAARARDARRTAGPEQWMRRRPVDAARLGTDAAVTPGTDGTVGTAGPGSAGRVDIDADALRRDYAGVLPAPRPVPDAARPAGLEPDAVAPADPPPPDEGQR